MKIPVKCYNCKYFDLNQEQEKCLLDNTATQESCNVDSDLFSKEEIIEMYINVSEENNCYANLIKKLTKQK